MDNGGGRGKWKNEPYNHTVLRQPNINIGNSNQTEVVSHSTPSVSNISRLSIDAPEFVPRKNKTHVPVGMYQDPAIIHQSQTFTNVSTNNLPHFQQPHHQHHQQQQQHHHPHHHHQQQHHQFHHMQNQPVNPHNPQHHSNTMAMVNNKSVQNRLNISNHGGGGGHGSKNSNYNADNMFSSNHGPQQSQAQSHSQQEQFADNEGYYSGEKEWPVFAYLSDVMKQLTDNPGLFESIQYQLTELFTEYASNEFVMSNALELIFELSVEEQNFRYMGARLCRLLDCLDMNPHNLFRRLLCLKIDDHQTMLQQFILNNEKRKVRGTTSFLAELYMQMQNHGTRIMKIADSIVAAMSLLLDKVGPENIKCVCQAIKLCGYELELDCPRDLRNIMGKLESLRGTLDVSTGRLLESVLELRDKRWGRSEPVGIAPMLETVGEDYNDVPVFFNDEGNQVTLTEEENSFLLAEYDDCNDSDELVEAEPEMDLEIQLAFKDFVKSTKNQQRQQK